MNSTRLFTVLGALAFPLAVAMVSNGCSKEEEAPIPVVSAPTPVPVASPAPIATIMPEEDAGADAADDADAADAAKKATGPGVDTTGIKKCCAALAQNANSAPPEQKGAYMAAAAACNGMVSTAQGRQALAGLRGLLLGAQMPSSCQ